MPPVHRLGLSAPPQSSSGLNLARPPACAQEAGKGIEPSGAHVLRGDPGGVAPQELKRRTFSPELAPAPPFRGAAHGVLPRLGEKGGRDAPHHRRACPVGGLHGRVDSRRTAPRACQPARARLQLGPGVEEVGRKKD